MKRSRGNKDEDSSEEEYSEEEYSVDELLGDSPKLSPTRKAARSSSPSSDSEELDDDDTETYNSPSTWIFMELTDENINYIQDTYDISPSDLGKQLINKSNENIETHGDQCGVFVDEWDKDLDSYTEEEILNKIKSFTRYDEDLDRSYRIRNFITLDIDEENDVKAISGFVSIKMLDDIKDNIFRFDDRDDFYAVTAYISWTCSFTHSIELKERYSKIIRNQGKISVSKFLTDSVCELLLQEAGEVEDNVDNVILWSIGTSGARPAHRKVGKRNTCTFLKRWHPIYDEGFEIDEEDAQDKNIYTAFPEEEQLYNNMFYFYPERTRRELVDDLGDENVDIVKKFKNKTFLNIAYFYSDENYYCPSGEEIN
jgi:hypothetical protein